MRSLAVHNNAGANEAMHSSKQKAVIQPKLMVNSPGDRYEREADAMADRVMSIQADNGEMECSTGMIGKSVQRKCAKCQEEEKKKKGGTVMRKAESRGGFEAPASVKSNLMNSGGGAPLPQTTRLFMENAFSTDFSHVRIHTDSSASAMNKEVNAKGFTYGSDIYFNSGQFATESYEGKRLLAHELTHTLQQGGQNSSIQRNCDPTISSCVNAPGGDLFSTASRTAVSSRGSGTSPVDFNALFNQSSTQPAPPANLPAVSAGERQVLVQMEFKPTLDLLLSEHLEAQARARRYDQNAFGTGGGIGVFPGFTYGARRQWGIGSLGNRNAVIQDVENSRNALDELLRVVGLNNTEEIAQIDSNFILSFRDKAKQVAFFMLDQSEHVTTAEYDRYTNIPVNQCSSVIPQLRQSAQRLANFQYELVNLMNATALLFNQDAPYGYPQGPTNITADDYYRYIGGSVFSSDRQVQSQLTNFRRAIQEEGLKFPVLLKEHLNYIQLGYNMTDEQLRQSVIGHTVEVLGNIRRSRDNINDDNIWDLDPVINATIDLFGIHSGSYAHAYLTRNLSDRRRNQAILDIFLSAIGVILSIVAIFATGGLAAFAIVGGTAIGGYQTYQHLRRYNFEVAARGSALDINQSIGSNFDPSILSLAFDVAMTIVGFAQAALALRGVGVAFRAANAVGREATAIERVAAQAGALDFETNISRFANAEGFIAERVSDDVIRITHPSIQGEFILTRQSLRYQTPTGTGMRVQFETAVGRGSAPPSLTASTGVRDPLPVSATSPVSGPVPGAATRSAIPRVEVGAADILAMRQRYGIGAADDTLALGRTDVAGLERNTFEGASRQIRATAPIASPTPHVEAPRANALFTDHAEQDVVNAFIDAVDEAGLHAAELEGRTLAIHISNQTGVCVACRQGAAGSGVDPGVLFQLSNRYPGLIIRVTWNDAAGELRNLIIVGGGTY